MKKSIKFSLVILSIMFILFISGFLVMKSSILDFVNQFRSFSVTIDNQSDYDLTSVETGVLVSGPNGEAVESDSKETLDQTIESGEKLKIRPILSLSGEGGIYLRYNSEGKETKKTICSYTESLSGYSKVIITNSNVTVEEKCN